MFSQKTATQEYKTHMQMFFFSSLPLLKMMEDADEVLLEDSE